MIVKGNTLVYRPILILFVRENEHSILVTPLIPVTTHVYSKRKVYISIKQTKKRQTEESGPDKTV